MAEATAAEATLPAPDSCNQATGEEDTSVKTIEFLRARLLAERAASKAAREQALQIANKVKDLQGQLEREIEHRKEAETSISKIFAILKAKGLAVDGLALALLENGLTKLDVIKEAVEEPSIDKREVSGLNVLPPAAHVKHAPLLKGDLSNDERVSEEPSKNDMVEQKVSRADDTHVEVNAHNECSDDVNVALVTGEKSNVLHQFRFDDDEVKHAVISKPMGIADQSRPDCASESDKETLNATHAELAMTLKLKAMLHQMEEEVHALPTEQPLKAELQHWVDCVVSVLDKGNVQQLPGPRDSGEVGEFNQPQNVQHTQEVDARSAAAITEKLVQRNLHRPTHSSTGDNMIYPQFDTLQPSSTLHNRRPSYDSFNGISYRSQNVPSMQWHEQLSLLHNTSAHPSMSTHGHRIYDQITGAELPYFPEAQSPKSSVGPFSMKGLYDQGQWCEGRSLGRVPSFRSQGVLGEETLLSPLSSAFVHDAPDNPCINKEHHHFRRVNISLDKRFGYHQSTGTIQEGRHPREDDTGYASSLQNASHLNNAMLSLVDDKNGRLGNVLTTLDAVWQRVNCEEQFVESSMPTMQADPRFNNRGYYCGDGVPQRLRRDYPSGPPTSRVHSHAPIVQFPPSPSSEHGYSPFQRHERHRRSSSVATDFTMSGGWDGYLQPRGGEVQLGNGITLYTD